MLDLTNQKQILYDSAPSTDVQHLSMQSRPPVGLSWTGLGMPYG